MIDQTQGGDASFAREPYEIHGLPAPVRCTAKPVRPGRLRIASAATLGLVAVAGVSWAAMSFLAAESGRPRRGAVVTGSVDYPDLKDGVPAITAPRGQVRVVGTPSTASPAQEVAATTASPVDSSAMASLAGRGVLPRPTISPAPGPVQATVRPAPLTAAAAPATASRADGLKTVPAAAPLPATVAAPATIAGAAPSMPAATAPVPLSAPLSAPLPAPRPAAAAPTRTAARPPDATRPAEQPRGAAPATTLPPQRVSASRPSARVEPAPATPATDEDDHINVFGLAVPTIGATSRRIKESVEALGDAVGRL